MPQNKSNFEKKYGLPDSVKFLKQSTIKQQLRKVKSINDLLARDNVSTVLQEVNEIKSNIKNIIIIYQTNNERIHYNFETSDTLTTLGMLEYAKDMMLENLGDEE